MEAENIQDFRRLEREANKHCSIPSNKQRCVAACGKQRCILRKERKSNYCEYHKPMCASPLWDIKHKNTLMNVIIENFGTMKENMQLRNHLYNYFSKGNVTNAQMKQFANQRIGKMKIRDIYRKLLTNYFEKMFPKWNWSIFIIYLYLFSANQVFYRNLQQKTCFRGLVDEGHMKIYLYYMFWQFIIRGYFLDAVRDDTKLGFVDTSIQVPNLSDIYVPQYETYWYDLMNQLSDLASQVNLPEIVTNKYYFPLTHQKFDAKNIEHLIAFYTWSINIV